MMTPLHRTDETAELQVCQADCRHGPVHEAILQRDPGRLRALLQEPTARPDVNTRLHSTTPLHVACHMGDLAMATLLLENGAEVDCKCGQDKSTALHWTSSSGHKDLTALLLTKGTEVNIRDVQGRTPLWLAASRGHQAVVHHLLEQRVDVNASNHMGITPLIVAVLNGFPETARSLLAAGANVDQADFFSNTPLLHAVKSGQREVVRILLEAHADANKPNLQGERPVHLAATYGNVTALKHLVMHDCDVNLSTTAGAAPITIALRRQHLEAVELLIEAGAALDEQDMSTPLPLIEAVCADGGGVRPRTDLLLALLRGGADVNRRSAVFDLTPLEHALLNGRRRAALLLLQADSDPPRRLDFVDLSKDDPPLYAEVERVCRDPPSIRRLCRRIIRRQLGYGLRYQDKVMALTLPKALKEFVLYKDLDPDVDIYVDIC